MNYRDTFVKAASSKRGEIGLKSQGQIDYVKAIRNNEVVLCSGPAGTGKTFLAVACAMEYLRLGKVNRIVMTRPAIEAGERLGFLPGNFDAKVMPYLRPLLDALYSMVEVNDVNEMVKADILEIAPLAYMRGRTFNDSFMVLDESQNTTPTQMKMYLTRMGKGSKSVVVGDVSQSDLDMPNGFEDALMRLRGVVGFAQLTPADTQRHPVVQKIVEAYESGISTPSPRF